MSLSLHGLSLQNDNKFHCTFETETLFKQIQSSITQDVTLTEPNTNHPLFVIVVFPSIGIGCVLFQNNDIGKLDNIPYFSRIHTSSEENLCTTYRELIRNIFSLTIYKQIIIDSDYLVNVLNEQKPTISCFNNKGNFSPIFYTARLQVTKFQKPSFDYRGKKILTAADLLGRPFTQKDLQLNQLKPKQ